LDRRSTVNDKNPTLQFTFSVTKQLPKHLNYNRIGPKKILEKNNFANDGIADGNAGNEII